MMSTKLNILNVVGARPNFMKIAPIMEQMREQSRLDPILVHTGQHYDQSMSKLFFEDLRLPRPNVYLDIGSASHGEQTGRIMIEFESVLLKEKPDLVLVVGDVNSTIACGLVAVKQGVKLAHVEAGLRSYDRSMPEEINRILTDQISDFLFTTEQSGNENLAKEGIAADKVFFVGNVMIDSLLSHLDRARDSNILREMELTPQQYTVLTLHRPSNVDSPEQFSNILAALTEIQKQLPIVFPIHPRSRERLQRFELGTKLQEMPDLRISNPLGYLDFLKLLSDARFVLTDSGGIQEETTVLGVPCLTLRENTERPVTVAQGTNTIVGTNTERIISQSQRVLQGQTPKGRPPDLWDGKAAQRITDILLEQL